jgi:hypothetical protein
VQSAPTLPQDPGSQSPGLAVSTQRTRRLCELTRRLCEPYTAKAHKNPNAPAAIHPVVVTFLAVYLSGGSASRLHLLVSLFAKPVMTLAFTALLLFVVQRSTDICRSVFLGCDGRRFCPRAPQPSAPRRHLYGYIDLQLDIPEPPCLPTLFQRPPPAFAP